jgi:hypothetical protein
VGDPAVEPARVLQPLRLPQLVFQLVPLGPQFQPLGQVADRGDDQEAIVGIDRR